MGDIGLSKVFKRTFKPSEVKIILKVLKDDYEAVGNIYHGGCGGCITHKIDMYSCERCQYHQNNEKGIRINWNRANNFRSLKTKYDSDKNHRNSKRTKEEFNFIKSYARDEDFIKQYGEYMV